MSTPSANHKSLLASLGAVASLVVASSCCLPVLPFAVAAGAAGGSALLTSLRPYLLAASVLFLAFGFYQARRARQCERQPNWLSRALLWLSAAVVLVSIFLPETVAALVAGGGSAPAGQPSLVALNGGSFDRFPQAFNGGKGTVRVVALLSPT
jgi:hypothetical protein